MSTMTMDGKGLVDVSRKLTDLEKRQLPFATIQALNKTAADVRQMWMDKANQVFDRPTPMTQKAVIYIKATREVPAAVVKIRDEVKNPDRFVPPSKYLTALIDGGVRSHKGFEKALQDAGVMTASEFAMPGTGLQLDAYGNISGGIITAMLSAARAHRVDGLNKPYRAVETSTRRKYEKRTIQTRTTFKTPRKRKFKKEFFAVRIAGQRLKPGIYERLPSASGSAIRPALIFTTKAPQYKKQYDVFKYASKTFARMYPVRFENELQNAILSAQARGWS